MVTRSTIGLDIGSSAVRAAELAFRRDGVRVERFGQVPLPEGAVVDGEVVDGPAVTAALRLLWRTARFPHKRVTIGIAHQRVVVRRVELPDLPPADLARALPFQVQDVLPMPVASALLDFVPLERSQARDGSPVVSGFLVAAWEDAVRTTLDAVSAAGLRVEVVDLTPFALLRSLGTGLEEDVATEAVVDVGAGITNVVIHTAGVPHFVRIVARGGADVTRALAESTGVPPAEAEDLKRTVSRAVRRADGGEPLSALEAALDDEVRALVEDVRRTIDYHATSDPSHPVRRIVLAGGGSQLAGLADDLAEATGVLVRRGSVAARVRPAGVEGEAGEATGAAGAAGAASAVLPDESTAAVCVGLALGASA